MKLSIPILAWGVWVGVREGVIDGPGVLLGGGVVVMVGVADGVGELVGVLDGPAVLVGVMLGVLLGDGLGVLVDVVVGVLVTLATELLRIRVSLLVFDSKYAKGLSEKVVETGPVEFGIANTVKLLVALLARLAISQVIVGAL